MVVRVDDVAQLQVGRIAEQKYRTDDPPQFTKREVQPVLAAVAVQPAQDIGWQNGAGADGNG
jgi:hypothetical protein